MKLFPVLPQSQHRCSLHLIGALSSWKNIRHRLPAVWRCYLLERDVEQGWYRSVQMMSASQYGYSCEKMDSNLTFCKKTDSGEPSGSSWSFSREKDVRAFKLSMQRGVNEQWTWTPVSHEEVHDVCCNGEIVMKTSVSFASDKNTNYSLEPGRYFSPSPPRPSLQQPVWEVWTYQYQLTYMGDQDTHSDDEFYSLGADVTIHYVVGAL